MKGTCTAGSIRVDSLEPVFKEILAKLNVLALVKSSASTINSKLTIVTGQLVAERAKLKGIKAVYAAKQSPTILDLIYEADATIAVLKTQEDDFSAELAADEIVDKEDLFSRPDLETYAGRSRANRILKRLKVEVLIEPSEPRFSFLKDLQSQFDLDYRSGKTATLPHTPDQFEAYKRQEGDARRRDQVQRGEAPEGRNWKLAKLDHTVDLSNDAVASTCA